MQIQYLRYFVAIADKKHFGEAAAHCAVSQPTLSAGLRALEQGLGKRLVERDRRFISLTKHGELILPWAQQILGSLRGLVQAADTLTAPLQGEFRLAAIPAALPLIGPFCSTLLKQNPGLTLAIHSATSRDIDRGLVANSFDAGVTYLDHEPLSSTLSLPLHSESYLLLARRGGAFDAMSEVNWVDIATHPMCLLHQGMQFRRILDREFAARGLAVSSVVIADSYVALLAIVRAGKYVTIIPDAYADLVAGSDWSVLRRLSDPAPERRVGLVVPSREPMGPMAMAALRALKAQSS